MITSNAKDVAARLSRKSKELPKVVSESVAPRRHFGALVHLAEEAMVAVAVTDEERKAIPLILKTILGRKTEVGASYSARAVSIHQLEAIDPNDPLGGVPRDEVVKWVAQFKEKRAPQDQYKRGPKAGQWYEDSVLATRVLRAIEINPDPWFRTDEPGRGALNPTGLAAIVGITGLQTANVERLLLAIARIWSIYAREAMPQAVINAVKTTLR